MMYDIQINFMRIYTPIDRTFWSRWKCWLCYNTIIYNDINFYLKQKANSLNLFIKDEINIKSSLVMFMHHSFSSDSVIFPFTVQRSDETSTFGELNETNMSLVEVWLIAGRDPPSFC